MKNYEFRLTPAYCLYNGIAVKKQKGSEICFALENQENELLKQRITKAFSHYLEYVKGQKDCPGAFKNPPVISFEKVSRSELRKYVSRLYLTGTAQENLVIKNQSTPEENAAAVLLLDTLISDARNRGATDIHIENNCIRFRVYGKLELISKLSEEKTQELVQRIKFLAGMNVLEKRRSQDGHFVYGKEKPVFIRVSTVGILGSNQNSQEESVVIRLLDTNRLPLNLLQLGFTVKQLSKIQELCQYPNGLVIICGPTGAGKSTTAASILTDIQQLKNNSVKIISLEDTPEYLIPGVTQIQIDEKTSNSFSHALMHIFRQDPDILMIGEIRDENSAAVAVRAALTGHLVFATLHTSSAAGAVLRLENLGIPRNLIVSVLKGVIAQELNNFHGNVNLVADVCVPLKKIETPEALKLSENELDELFEHTTNYISVLNKSLSVLKQKHSVNTELPQKPAARKTKPIKLPLITPRKSKRSKENAG